jgi:hypothetical protein
MRRVRRAPRVLAFVSVAVGGALLAVSPLDGQEPTPAPASASSASSDPSLGPEFFGFRLGASRADVEEILRSKEIAFREDAFGRLRFAGSPDPNLRPAPEVSHVVFDVGNRLVLVDFRWPLGAEAPNPYDQLLRGFSGRFGPGKRTGVRDYWWNVKDAKHVAVHLYENLRRTRGGGAAPETALQYLVSGAQVAQGVDRLD